MTTRSTTLWTTALFLAAGVCLAGFTSPARADRGPDKAKVKKFDRDDRKDYGRRERDDDWYDKGYGKGNRGHRHDDGPDFFIGFRYERVWVEPVYRTVTERVWVEESYRTVCEKVWVPPVTRTVCEKVWVEDGCDPRFSVAVGGENFRFVFRDGGRRSGHWETREREVIVEPGYYRTIERRVCVPAHWETVTRRELVCEGRYEMRRVKLDVCG